VVAKSPVSKIIKSNVEPNSILFVLFIPSKDKDGHTLPKGQDQQMWADAAGDVLTRSFGGSTEMPKAKGKWLNDETNMIVTEEIILIHSYAKQADSDNERKLGELARFLHRMGKELRQGEIAVLIDGVFHKIRKFTLAEGGK
jgi:hypothetical protein